jgi:guanylate kinase
VSSITTAAFCGLCKVEDALSRGTDVVLRVDIQGAATVRRLMPSAVSIFLVCAPSLPGHRVLECSC